MENDVLTLAHDVYTLYKPLNNDLGKLEEFKVSESLQYLSSIIKVNTEVKTDENKK
jgi:hypothetical protein